MGTAIATSTSTANITASSSSAASAPAATSAAASTQRSATTSPAATAGTDLTTKKTVGFWKSFLRQQQHGEGSPQRSTSKSTAEATSASDADEDAAAASAEEREAFDAVEDPLATDRLDEDADALADADPSAPHVPQRPPIAAPTTMASPALALQRTEGYLVVEQEQIYTHVLVPVEEDGTLDSRYLVAVLLEYVRTLNYQHIAVKSFLYEFLIDQLVRSNRYYELHQLLQYHVIADSLHVACQLLALERAYAPAYQLALDMLKRLGAHEQIVEVLLAKGHIVPALRYALKLTRRQQMIQQQQQSGDPSASSPAASASAAAHEARLVPRRFLEAARDQPALFFTVYKHLEQAGRIDVSLEDYRTLYQTLFLRSADDDGGAVENDPEDGSDDD